MSWGLTPETVALLQAGVVRPRQIARFDYAPQPARWAASAIPIWYDDDGDGPHEYRAAGVLGQVSEASASGSAVPVEVTFSLSGLDPASVATALIAAYRGRAVTWWQVLVDERHQVVGTPQLRFKGRMSRQQIVLGETATIVVTAQSHLVDWQRPLVRYRTHAQRQARHPDDQIFKQVAQTAQRELVWGRKT